MSIAASNAMVKHIFLRDPELGGCGGPRRDANNTIAVHKLGYLWLGM
jgi:hypothetical protein